LRRWWLSFNEGGVNNLHSNSRQRNSEEETLEEQILVLKNNVAKVKASPQSGRL
jgi:hypothetical protein